MGTRRRGWFRLHLSTAVILMFAAGGLMYMQTTPSAGDPDKELLNENWRYASEVLPFQNAPRIKMELPNNKIPVTVDSASAIEIYQELSHSQNYKIECYGWPFHGVIVWKGPEYTDRFVWIRAWVFDGLVAIAILALVWVETEEWIAPRLRWRVQRGE